jgi:hypothetical protein
VLKNGALRAGSGGIFRALGSPSVTETRYGTPRQLIPRRME